MKELETSRHLFQRPLYQTPSKRWTYDFNDALSDCGPQVHLDPVAVASILSFCMEGSDRTLLKEISRRPWLSKIDESGGVVLETPPPHGFMSGSDEQVGARFFALLCDEARVACSSFKTIYVLLSGGMDSRIIAGVLSNLYERGELSAKPIAITWGDANSRDAVYARQVAEVLGFEWQNVEFGPERMLENIEATACHLGLLHSPELLHNMLWFKNIPADSLVIAGSFGDSIGRAEFGGRHLLLLDQRVPKNMHGLLKGNVFQAVRSEMNRDLETIHSRSGREAPGYVKNELWMQGYRMRGGLCHSLSIINSFANIYQMFTAPEVYGFMWSLHPARRNDDIYAAILEHEMPSLARIPWARTNRAMRGETVGARDDLKPDFHEYTKWSSGVLASQLNQLVDPDWFESMALFDAEGIRQMKQRINTSQHRIGEWNNTWLWLAGFRRFAGYLEENGKELVIPRDWPEAAVASPPRESFVRRSALRVASNSKFLNKTYKLVRRGCRAKKLMHLKEQLLKDCPPTPLTEVLQ